MMPSSRLLIKFFQPLELIHWRTRDLFQKGVQTQVDIGRRKRMLGGIKHLERNFQQGHYGLGPV